MTKIKVCKCHSVSYCKEECQREDWPRHSDNCVPVMVKEYGEKGKGLVASKAIKVGELILNDKAAVSLSLSTMTLNMRVMDILSLKMQRGCLSIGRFSRTCPS